MKKHPVSAMAHITGGGIAGNLARVLPEGLGATLDLRAFPRPPVFQWLLAEGVPTREALNIFNMGLGMVLVVPRDGAVGALGALSDMGCDAFEVGEIKADVQGVHLEGVEG
jgi:phosphoribosylaminoimidazole (AIR) synthetase